MDKKTFSQEGPSPPPRPSLAEEQRLAFEADQRRIRRSSPLRWPGFLFRN